MTSARRSDPGEVTLPQSRHIVLVGMMGTGKTTVGRLLAARLGRRLFDSDELIEARTGRTVREIFESDGEPAFRDLESAALAEALADERPAVIAAAGGVVLRQENRAALCSATVVWLTAEPPVLAGRVSPDDHRPLLAGDAEARLGELLAQRAHLYAEVSDATVATDSAPAEAVAEQIIELVDG